MSSQSEPLNLKEFIYELDVPVIVGGCATYQAALHLMRTGAAGVLVGFGGGAAHTTRTVLGVAVPMASAVAGRAGARRDYLDESGGRYVHVIADGRSAARATSPRLSPAAPTRSMIGSPLARAERGARPRLPLGQRGHARRSCRAASASASSRSGRWRRSCSDRREASSLVLRRAGHRGRTAGSDVPARQAASSTDRGAVEVTR